MQRIVDIETDGRRLSAIRGFMLVADADGEVGRVPLDDVAAGNMEHQLGLRSGRARRPDSVLWRQSFSSCCLSAA